MNKELRKKVKDLEERGFTVVHGRSHAKLYDADGRFVFVLPHGNNRDRVPGGSAKELQKILKRWEDDHA